MRDSVRLGRIFDIPIGLHWSIALIAGLFTFVLAGTILPGFAPGYLSVMYLPVAVSVAVALLASIIAHELGHSLVARRHGIPVKGITLFALGGMAKLDGDPRSPGAAARIALAGPAVSVVIGLLALGATAAAGAVGASALIVAGLLWLGAANLVMAVFNMLPALPLDGGRVLQAALWKRGGDREQATISAAKAGRWIGWAVVAFGLWSFLSTGSGLWTMLIGWFIVSSAKAEALRARFLLRSRHWAPPLWSTWRGPAEPPFRSPFGPPTGAPGRSPWDRTGPGAPTSAPHPGVPVDVIDVDSRRVG